MEHARPCGNLSEGTQNTRLRGAVIALGVTLAVAVTLLKLEVSAPVRLLLFVPFLFAATGLYQGLHRT